MMKYACIVIVLSICLSLCKGHDCDRNCTDSEPMVCEYDFTLEWYSTLSKACYECPYNITDCSREHCIAADGVVRAITVVNRMLPGPPITVCHDDTIVVRVRNMLENGEGTAIHWHGIYQVDTQWMDGVPMVTQCAIPTKTTFTYKFKANPPGTHWWHSHDGFQRSDGVAGVLIVKTLANENPNLGLYDEDKYSLMVGDWLHQTTMDKYVQHHHSSGNNKGESILINGKGEFNDTESNSPQTPLEEFVVEKNKRYRFRVVNNAAVFCPFRLTVDDHNLTVIATDGSDVIPYEVTSLVTHGGETFDFVLSANNAASAYWMRVQGLADCRNQSQKAVVRYSTIPENTRPTTQPSEHNDLNPLNPPLNDPNPLFVTSLTSSYPIDDRLKGDPDHVFYLGFDFKKIDNPVYNDPDLYPISFVPRNDELYSPQINNVTWKDPTSPFLTQFNDVDKSGMCNTATGENVPDSEFRLCSQVFSVDKEQLIELVVFDEGITFNAGHPMHLHGQHFAVVSMDRVSDRLSLNEVQTLHSNGSIKYNFESPVMKDSIIIPDGGYAVLRFMSDNPGVWVFHCHLSFHLAAGMNVAFRVGNTDDVTGIPANFPRCGNWDGPGSTTTEITTTTTDHAHIMSPSFTCLFLCVIYYMFSP